MFIPEDKMDLECIKCGYVSNKNKEKFGVYLCEFCMHFAPNNKEDFLIYINEKVLAKTIQTYRKQGKVWGIKQKKGMKTSASKGKSVSRPPFGYKFVSGNLIPSENSKLVEDIYEDFLTSNLSLNQFAKKYGFSFMGMKKILTNFTYLGKVKFEGELHNGNHKPLISNYLFNQVQDKLEKKWLSNE